MTQYLENTMKRFLIAMAFCAVFSISGSAQKNASDVAAYQGRRREIP